MGSMGCLGGRGERAGMLPQKQGWQPRRTRRGRTVPLQLFPLRATSTNAQHARSRDIRLARSLATCVPVPACVLIGIRRQVGIGECKIQLRACKSQTALVGVLFLIPMVSVPWVSVISRIFRTGCDRSASCAR